MSNAPKPVSPPKQPASVVFWLYFAALVSLLISELVRPLSWIDEFGPIAALGDSLEDTWNRVINFGQHPPLYVSLQYMLTSIAGKSEVVVRSLAFLPWVAAVLVFRKTVSRRVANFPADVAAILLLGNPLSIQIGVHNRPYALGLLFAVVAIEYFLSWRETAKAKYGLLSLLSYLLSVQFHILYLPLPLCLLLPLYWGAERLKLSKIFGTISIAVVLGALPLFPILSRLWIDRNRISYLPFPTTGEMFLIIPIPIWLSLAVLVIFEGTRTRWTDISANKQRLFLVGAGLLSVFWLGGFLVSVSMGVSIFIERHLGPFIFGAVLLPAYFGMFVDTKSHFKCLSLVFALTVIFGLSSLFEPHLDLKAAVRELTRLAEGDDALIVYSPGYIETSKPGGLPDPVVIEFAKSPLKYYGVDLPIILAPQGSHASDKEVRARIIETMSEIAPRAKRKLIFFGTEHDRVYEWLIPTFLPHLKLVETVEVGGYLLFEFEKLTPVGEQGKR